MKPKYVLDESLGYLTGRLATQILKRNSEKFAANGITLTPDQWIVLVQLYSHDGVCQQQVTSWLHKDKALTTRLVKILEQKGLLKRVAGRDDGREKIVYLTKEGKAVMRQATELVQEVLDRSYEGIDAGELDICRSVLRRAFNNLA